MPEHLPDHEQENNEIIVEPLLIKSPSNDPLTPVPETPPLSPTRITAPLRDPETPLPEVNESAILAAEPETALAREIIPPVLPNLEETIDLSSRAQRVLLYLARRSRRKAAAQFTRDPDQHLPARPLARITRPLKFEEPIGQDGTPAISSISKITKPLASEEISQQSASSPSLTLLPTSKITRPLASEKLDIIDTTAQTSPDTLRNEVLSSTEHPEPDIAPLPAPPSPPPVEAMPDISRHPTAPLGHANPDIALLPTVIIPPQTEPETPPNPALPPAATFHPSEQAALSNITRHPTSPLRHAVPPRSASLPSRGVPHSVQPAFPLPGLQQAATSPLQSPTRTLRPYISPATRRTNAQRHRLKRIYRLQYFTRKHLREARANDRKARRRLWTTIWTTTSSLLLLFLAIGGVIGYIAYNFINTTQGTYASQVLTLRDMLPPDNLKIYDAQGTMIDQLTDQGIHTEVKYNQIAPDLVDATIAIEDRTFWSNSGVDIMGILRAALADLESGQAIQGGSTITQQLIKQLIVGNSTDAVRKLSEIVLAPQVNSHYSKRDIMEMYLNTIYYGYQAYGIDAAATVYFGLEDKDGKSAASQLDLAQSAMLAGLPRNASLYDPFASFQTATDRFYNVLEAMVAQGYITQIQAQAAYQEEQAPHFFKSSPTLQDQAPHFDEYVLSQLEQMYHLTRSQLSRSGLVVTTTLNVSLQNKILQIMQQHIAEIRSAHNVTNAAEVLIDFHTGAIISMLGSIDYNNKAIDGQFNVALAYRQPGSSFKPYVYVTAFAQGTSPAQAIDDAPTTIDNPGGTPSKYTPSNYDLHFHGHMTLRCALQNSLNVPAVRVLQHVGITNAMQMAQAMGITNYKGTLGPALVLGDLDIRLLDHTSAMGVFANSGVREPYYSISKVVQGTTGKVLFQHQQTPGTQVITPQLAYMMTNVLSDNTSRTPEFFDCNVLQLYANSQQDCYNGNRGVVRPAAAKTGTTQDFRDNLTVGYTTDFVMGVWAGNDDNSPMINVTGVQGAAPIWHDAMLLAEQDHPIQDFQNPGGLVRATVTYPDGVQATDWFLPGTVPPSGEQQPTPPSNPGQNNPSVTPYCSTFSFAFQPPAGNGIPTNGGWW